MIAYLDLLNLNEESHLLKRHYTIPQGASFPRKAWERERFAPSVLKYIKDNY